MNDFQAHLRSDNPNHPAFLMMHRPPPLSEAQGRATEWILATWVCIVDSNVHGIRRVVEERNGQAVPMVHIAIPLAYQRRQLARTLGLEQIEDEQATPRVNLASSNGFDEPHSYIRVPLEIVMKRFTAYMQACTLETEINDETIAVPASVLEEYERAARQEDHRLRSAVRHALAMRNAAIDPHHIQTLINKQTHEKWIRIRNVEKSVRTSLRLAIKQAGIQTASVPADEATDWAILFTASEARKLLA
jgi:hypothetical protein